MKQRASTIISVGVTKAFFSPSRTALLSPPLCPVADDLRCCLLPPATRPLSHATPPPRPALCAKGASGRVFVLLTCFSSLLWPACTACDADSVTRTTTTHMTVHTSPHRGGGGRWVSARAKGWVPDLCDWLPTSSCLVSQPPRLLTVPKPHQGAGGREIAPYLCVLSACRGGLGGGVQGIVSGHSGTPLFFSGGPRSYCWRVGGGGDSGPQQRGLSSGGGGGTGPPARAGPGHSPGSEASAQALCFC